MMNRRISIGLSALGLFLLGLGLGFGTAALLGDRGERPPDERITVETDILAKLMQSLPPRTAVLEAVSFSGGSQVSMVTIRTRESVEGLIGRIETVVTDTFPAAATELSNLGPPGVRFSASLAAAGPAAFLHVNIARLGDGEEGSHFLVTASILHIRPGVSP